VYAIPSVALRFCSSHSSLCLTEKAGTPNNSKRKTPSKEGEGAGSGEHSNDTATTHKELQPVPDYNSFIYIYIYKDHLCGLVVRVSGC
jgi:hypothetical protein